MAQWDFTVLDKMSDPLRAMGKSVDNLEGNIEFATKEIDKFERAARLESLKSAPALKQQTEYMKMYREDLEKARHAQEKASKDGGFFQKALGAEGFFAMEQIERVAQYTMRLGELGVQFIKLADEVSDFKGDSIATMEVMTGSTEAAKAEFEMLGKLAHGSSMTKQEVMAQYSDLFSFTQKFGTEATRNVITAGADIEKLLGKNAQSAFVGVMKNIDAMGGLTTRSVQQLKETGIATPEKLYAALAAELHTTAKGAEKLVQAGKVSQETSINALLELVVKNVNKGEGLGFYALKQSGEDLGDSMKNLKEDFLAVFEDVDTAPIAKGLQDIAAQFDPATENGKKMRALVEKAFNDIGKAVQYAADHMGGFISKAESALATIEKVVGFMDKHPTLLKILGGAAAGGAVGGVWGAAIGAAGAAGVVGGGVIGEAVLGPTADVGAAEASRKDAEKRLAEMQEKLNQKLLANEALEVQANEAGVNTAKGFMVGFAEKLDVQKVVQDKVVEAMNKSLEIKSPSKVMKAKGEYSGQGFMDGFSDRLDISGAMSRELNRSQQTDVMTSRGMLSMPAPAVAAGSSAMGPIQVVVQNTFQGGAPTDPMQQSQLDAQISHAVETGVLRAFESLSHS